MFPAKPLYLSDTASEAWNCIVEDCQAAGVKLEAKGDVLERYAVALANWRKCTAAIEEEGQTVISFRKDGPVTERNPRMVDLHQLTAAIGRLRAELGLAPVRTKPRSETSSTKPDTRDDQSVPEVVYKIPR